MSEWLLFKKKAFSELQLLGLYTQDTSSDEATAVPKEETAENGTEMCHTTEMWYRKPEEYYENTLQESKMCEEGKKNTESLRQEKISKISESSHENEYD